MKRAELARLTGYSERHISRIADTIPGASRTPGGHWVFDSESKELHAWIESALTQNKAKAARKTAGFRRETRKFSIGTAPENFKQMERFTAALNAAWPTLLRIEITGIGLKMPPGLPFEEWRLLLVFFKTLRDLPSTECIDAVLVFNSGLASPSLDSFFAALRAFNSLTQWSAHAKTPI